MNPGKKTSEFWLIIAFAVAYVLNGTEWVNIPWDQFPMLATMVSVYTGGRSWVKAKAVATA